MDLEKLVVLHDHYRDTCGVMRSQRAARDRYFYFVITLLAIVLFDLATPAGFANVISDVLRSRLQLSSAPNLEYVRTLLWFLLLGLTVRYCQTALGVERQYTYIHELEKLLSEQVPGAFRREGEAYLTEYPLFLSWAHYLYTLILPLLLCGTVVVWMYRQIPGRPPWPFVVWFDCAVTVAIVASVAMYLHAFHRRNRPRAEPGTDRRPHKRPKS
jgi:hypothetical protein